MRGQHTFIAEPGDSLPAKWPASLATPTSDGPPGWVQLEWSSFQGPEPTLGERLDLTLLNFATKCRRPGRCTDEQSRLPATFAWSPDGDEAGAVIVELQRKKLLEFGGNEQCRPTWDGWLRIEDLRRSRRTKGGKPIAFVAMWFDDSLQQAYDIGIAPAIDVCGFAPYCLKVSEHNAVIDDMIVAGIRSSEFVVADLTGHRPSVYYEAGFAFGLKREVILTVRADQLKDVHFDANHRRVIDWKDERDLCLRLEARIRATIEPPPPVLSPS
jgi:hypothetical protein